LLWAKLMKNLRPTKLVILPLHFPTANLLDDLFVFLAEDDLEGGRDVLGNLVLDGEHVFELPIELAGPELVAVRDVSKLRVDAEPVAGLAHTSFQHRADAQLLADFANIFVSSLEGKRRRAGRHVQSLHLAQGVDQLFGEAV